MHLTAEERAILRGERGEGARFCLDLLCQLGELFGAPDLIPIAQAHIDANLYLYDAGLEFALHVRRLGARVSVPTTLNVTGRDAAAWREFRVPAGWAERCAQMDAAYVEMGARPTFTCTPYLLETAPAFGQDVAWGESNAIAFVNSWIGARTERYADFVDLCAAVAGRVPRAGLHVPANRLAQLLVSIGEDVPQDLRRHESFFPVLGYAIGEVAGDRVAAVEGLPAGTTRDQVKALCAATASSGAVGLIHLVGITPEAPTLEATGLPAGAPVEVLDFGRLDAVRRRLSAAAAEVDLVALGSPHLSYEEACEVERRLAGRRVHPRMALWLTTSRAVHALLTASGRLARLAAAGARVMRDACVVVQPMHQWGFRGLMTNSGKYAHYSAAQVGLPARFGTLADCVETAVRGEVVAEEEAAVWRPTPIPRPAARSAAIPQPAAARGPTAAERPAEGQQPAAPLPAVAAADARADSTLTSLGEPGVPADRMQPDTSADRTGPGTSTGWTEPDAPVNRMHPRPGTDTDSPAGRAVDVSGDTGAQPGAEGTASDSPGREPVGSPVPESGVPASDVEAGAVAVMAARAAVKGRAAGRAVVSPEPISFWGDLDPAAGRIGNPRHALAGREVAGRVLVFRQGRGSSSAAQVLLEALRRGTAPAALVNVRTEPLLAVGPLVGQALYGRSLPVVSLAEADFARIADGNCLVVDADAGTVTLIRDRAPAG